MDIFWCNICLVRLSAHARAIPRSLRRSAFAYATKILPHRSRKSRLQLLSPPGEIPLHRAVVPLAVRIGHRIGASGRPGPGAADDVAEAEKVAGDRRFLRRSPGHGAARPDPVGARSETA